MCRLWLTFIHIYTHSWIDTCLCPNAGGMSRARFQELPSPKFIYMLHEPAGGGGGGGVGAPSESGGSGGLGDSGDRCASGGGRCAADGCSRGGGGVTAGFFFSAYSLHFVGLGLLTRTNCVIFCGGTGSAAGVAGRKGPPPAPTPISVANMHQRSF